ncbi:MAG: redoxin domain-containing protein [Armatimonadetes bacterium]|nr:redoxin domain-containing protein [Armatimonadota bacterium]MDE2205660.1 redoxin domain-containing protein [Armatimonadota bacterium]
MTQPFPRRFALCCAGMFALMSAALIGPAAGEQQGLGALASSLRAQPLGVVPATLTFASLGGRRYSGTSLRRYRASVFFFVSGQCPISTTYAPRIAEFAKQAMQKGVQVFADYPDRQETRAAIRADAAAHGYHFAVVADPRARVATAVGAIATPEAVIVDANGAIRYRGRIDDNVVTTLVTHHDLEDALDAVLSGKPVPHPETLAMGCAIRQPAVAPAPAAGVPTWSGQIASIILDKCASCHRSGQVAPFSLTTWRQANAWAPDIERYTQTGAMPPWKPAEGFGCRFVNASQRTLTSNELAAIRKWAENGAPEGDPAVAPHMPNYPRGWQIGKPDMILQASAPFHVPADGADIYRNFVVHTNFTQDRYLSAVEVHPGNRAVVHHIIVYIDGNRVSDRLDGRDHDGQPGYTSFGGPGFIPTGMLAGWAPGNEPVHLPQGIGIFVPKHANLVIQVHYHKNGEAQTDLSQIGLRFARHTIQQTINSIWLINFFFKIPPGDANYTCTAQTTVTRNMHLRAVTPHMHLLGRQMKIWADLPNGTRKDIIWIKDWDFNWQMSYGLRQPIELPKGTVLHLWASYDNSNDNPRNPNLGHLKPVGWGENTTDEMCIAFLSVTSDSQHLAVRDPIADTVRSAGAGAETPAVRSGTR